MDEFSPVCFSVLTVSDTEVAEETVISDEPTVKRQRVKEEDDDADEMTETRDIRIQQTISLDDFQVLTQQTLSHKNVHN